MNLEKVRNRIKYEGEFYPTYEVLKNLQRQFLLHVPFENLNIHLNIPIDYSSSTVFDKIVENKRGGLCYENNSLFYDILLEIGFKVNFISCEIYKDLPLKMDKFHRHMALSVEIDNEVYLVDVGNGKFFGNPISIHGTTYSIGEDTEYIVLDFEQNDELKFRNYKALYYRNSNGQILPRYVFDLTPRDRMYFEDACVFIESNPNSVFLKGTLVSLFKGNGRTTLTGLKLIKTFGGNREISSIISKSEFEQILIKEFGFFLEQQIISKLYESTSELVLG